MAESGDLGCIYAAYWLESASCSLMFISGIPISQLGVIIVYQGKRGEIPAENREIRSYEQLLKTCCLISRELQAPHTEISGPVNAPRNIFERHKPEAFTFLALQVAWSIQCKHHPVDLL